MIALLANRKTRVAGIVLLVFGVIGLLVVATGCLPIAAFAATTEWAMGYQHALKSRIAAGTIAEFRSWMRAGEANGGPVSWQGVIEQRPLPSVAQPSAVPVGPAVPVSFSEPASGEGEAVVAGAPADSSSGGDDGEAAVAEVVSDGEMAMATETVPEAAAEPATTEPPAAADPARPNRQLDEPAANRAGGGSNQRG